MQTVDLKTHELNRALLVFTAGPRAARCRYATTDGGVTWVYMQVGGSPVQGGRFSQQDEGWATPYGNGRALGTTNGGVKRSP